MTLLKCIAYYQIKKHGLIFNYPALLGSLRILKSCHIIQPNSGPPHLTSLNATCSVRSGFHQGAQKGEESPRKRAPLADRGESSPNGTWCFPNNNNSIITMCNMTSTPPRYESSPRKFKECTGCCCSNSGLMPLRTSRETSSRVCRVFPKITQTVSNDPQATENMEYLKSRVFHPMGIDKAACPAQKGKPTLHFRTQEPRSAVD